MESRAREFFWAAELNGKKKVVNWSGKKDGTLEQMVLKLAILGPGAKQQERSIVEITTFDSEQNKIKACLCSLSLGQAQNISLADAPLFPPVNFTLIEGSGPVHLIASHMVLEDDDDLSDDDMSDFEEELEAQKDKVNVKKKPDEKGDAPKKSQKLAKKQEEKEDDDEEDDDDDDEDLDDDSEEEEDEPKVQRKHKMNSLVELEAVEDDDEDDDLDDDMEDDSDEVEEEDEAPSKKRKLTNGKAAKQKEQAEKKMTSPERGAKNTPVEQKTPKSEKKDNTQTPKSAKKTPSKPKYQTVEEVKAAIAKFPGGKPRKQDKFINWLQNQFKVTEETWKNDLWKWHKKELGL